MKILAYEGFRECYRKLPAHIQRKVDRQLRVLARTLRYPSLQVKRIQGTVDIWEARVDQQYRLSFERRGDTIYLRAVGNHDDVLKHP